MPMEFGPPDVALPAWELLGEELLRAGKPADAAAAFRNALARAPGRTRSLEGLARSADLAGDASAAAKARTELARYPRGGGGRSVTPPPEALIDSPWGEPYAVTVQEQQRSMGFGLTRGASAPFPDNRCSRVWRLALSWTLVIAFALQSYATQTHFHIAPLAQAGGATPSAVASPSPGDQGDRLPLLPSHRRRRRLRRPCARRPRLSDDPRKIRGGAAIVVDLAIRAAGFSWRSRAPPQP